MLYRFIMCNMPKEYTVTELAKHLGVNKQMVLRWYWSGLFPNARRKNPFALRNSPIIIPAQDVEKFAVKFEKAQANPK
jgi:hypothetical protein